MTMKTCTKCNQDKPATLEYFYKHKINSFGDVLLKGHCKTCNKNVVVAKSAESNRRNASTFYHKHRETILKNRIIKIVEDKHCIQLVG